MAVAGERLAAGGYVVTLPHPPSPEKSQLLCRKFVSTVSYNSWLQSSQAGLTLSTMTVKAACLNLQGSLNQKFFRLSFDV